MHSQEEWSSLALTCVMYFVIGSLHSFDQYKIKHASMCYIIIVIIIIIIVCISPQRSHQI